MCECTYERKFVLGVLGRCNDNLLLLLISLLVFKNSFVHFVAENDFSLMHHDQVGLLEGMISPPEVHFRKVSMMTTCSEEKML